MPRSRPRRRRTDSEPAEKVAVRIPTDRWRDSLRRDASRLGPGLPGLAAHRTAPWTPLPISPCYLALVAPQKDETPDAPQPGDSSASSESGEATRLLVEGLEGAGRKERLLELVYDRLRALAAKHLARENVDHTLQPTALVHEAWVKMVDAQRVPLEGREHFLSLASQAMRRILIDHARGKQRVKRGGAYRRVSLESPEVEGSGETVVDLLGLDEALRKLEELSPRQAKVTELLFFGGLTAQAAASVLGVSARTVERDWRFARAWLHDELGSGEA